jgi:hypothetical protein
VAAQFLLSLLRLPRRCQGQAEQVEVPHRRGDRAPRLDSRYLLLMASSIHLALANRLGRIEPLPGKGGTLEYIFKTEQQDVPIR